MKKILIVDDEIEICNNLSDFFELEGFKTFTAPNGVKALEIVKSNLIDIVVTDIKMPEMDGLTLSKEIARLGKELPLVLIMSGHLREEDKEKNLPGVIGFFKKPFQEEVLVEFVKKFLKEAA